MNSADADLFTFVQEAGRWTMKGMAVRSGDLKDYLAFDEAGSLEVEFHAPKMIYV